MECPRCSETLSDRYRSFPSPVSSIRNPGISCINSDSSWKDRKLSPRPAVLPAPTDNKHKSKTSDCRQRPEEGELLRCPQWKRRAAAVCFSTTDSGAASSQAFSTTDSDRASLSLCV